MKVDYSQHDDAYKKRKKAGKPGWDDKEHTEETLKIFRKLMDGNKVPRSGNLLELGCGAGNLLICFSDMDYELYGMDISTTAIAWARERAEEDNVKARFLAGNIIDQDTYPDVMFDIILDGHCFHCIIGKDRDKFLSNAYRVLKPSGILIIATMCGEVTNDWAKEHYDPETRCLVIDGYAFRHIGLAEEIIQEIQKAGFDIIDKMEKPRANPSDQDEIYLICRK